MATGKLAGVAIVAKSISHERILDVMKSCQVSWFFHQVRIHFDCSGQHLVIVERLAVWGCSFLLRHFSLNN